MLRNRACFTGPNVDPGDGIKWYLRAQHCIENRQHRRLRSALARRKKKQHGGGIPVILLIAAALCVLAMLIGTKVNYWLVHSEDTQQVAH